MLSIVLALSTIVVANAIDIYYSLYYRRIIPNKYVFSATKFLLTWVIQFQLELAFFVQCIVRNLIKNEKGKSNSMMNISISKYLIGCSVEGGSEHC